MASVVCIFVAALVLDVVTNVLLKMHHLAEEKGLHWRKDPRWYFASATSVARDLSFVFGGFMLCAVLSV